MADIQMRLGAQVLVMQGAPQDDLRHMGLDETPAALLNLSEPESVAGAHTLQRAVGAEVGLSNTAGATKRALESAGLPQAMEDVNVTGVELAQQAEFPHVLAVIAGERPLPQDEALELARTIVAAWQATDADDDAAGEKDAGADDIAVDKADEENTAHADEQLIDVAQEFSAQASVLASAAPDAIYLAGAHGLGEAALGLAAAQDATDLPVLITLAADSFESANDREQDPWAHAAQTLKELGAAAIGVQGGSPEQVADVLTRMRSASDLPLIAVPDLLEAGAALPRRGTREEMQLADRAAQAGELVLRAGASLVGIGRGGSPLATGALYAHVGGINL